MPWYLKPAGNVCHLPSTESRYTGAMNTARVVHQARGLLWLLPTLAVPLLPAADLPAMQVQVGVQGDHVQVEARVPLPVSREEAWAVMTDYDHMARFLPNLEEARILNADGDQLTTYQRGVARFGPFTYAFHFTRAVELTPMQAIHSHLLEGNMAQFDAWATLREAQGLLWLDYHSDSIPDLWLPAFLMRPYVEQETRTQFDAIRQEMTRRHLHAGHTPGSVSGLPLETP